MDFETHIPEPILFSPLKHYLPFIKEFVDSRTLSITDPKLKELTREFKHIGTCVMDIYTGDLSQDSIFTEILEFLRTNKSRYGGDVARGFLHDFSGWLVFVAGIALLLVVQSLLGKTVKVEAEKDGVG